MASDSALSCLETPPCLLHQAGPGRVRQQIGGVVTGPEQPLGSDGAGWWGRGGKGGTGIARLACKTGMGLKGLRVSLTSCSH